jgi:type IV secretory pathway VirD2 relaxase
MELRSLAKNLAKEKYLKAKNEERQQLYNRHYYYQNKYYQHKHRNIQNMKYDKHKKERKSSRKCLFFNEQILYI